MSGEQRHLDAAGYALGVLEPADAFRFEEHLGGCAVCAGRLVEFGELTAGLSLLAEPGAEPGSGPGAGPGAGLAGRPPGPGGGLLGRLLDDVTAVRRRSRARWLGRAAAAAALSAALAGGVFAARGTGAAAGERITAADAATGVTASASVAERAWGTAVAMRISGVPAAAGSCRLFAVDRNGVEHPVLSWRTPAQGPGDPVRVEGGTWLPEDRIARWRVRTLAGEALVTIGAEPPLERR
ncbi:hypothetical protein [Streptomyces jumonjinensis]|uniref:hypothetical protein n=1 Tax=Streptomyces jumonjinensis TaxID=1945 RepID=UPI003787FEA4